jgi:hypothetical protein
MDDASQLVRLGGLVQVEGVPAAVDDDERLINEGDFIAKRDVGEWLDADRERHRLQRSRK